MVVSQSLSTLRNADTVNDFNGVPVQNSAAIRFSIQVPLPMTFI